MAAEALEVPAEAVDMARNPLGRKSKDKHPAKVVVVDPLLVSDGGSIRMYGWCRLDVVVGMVVVAWNGGRYGLVVWLVPSCFMCMCDC